MPPFLIVHGAEDSTVPFTSSIHFAYALSTVLPSSSSTSSSPSAPVIPPLAVHLPSAAAPIHLHICTAHADYATMDHLSPIVDVMLARGCAAHVRQMLREFVREGKRWQVRRRQERGEVKEVVNYIGMSDEFNDPVHAASPNLPALLTNKDVARAKL